MLGAARCLNLAVHQHGCTAHAAHDGHGPRSQITPVAVAAACQVRAADETVKDNRSHRLFGVEGWVPIDRVALCFMFVSTFVGLARLSWQ